ncbi:MAG: ribonuclease Z [Candidatus Thermoplasmatota archaeon]|jgi:ribonuclease Z|nr:ribonuclease Z [Candidatus Thermoplasmatota archaeon]MDP7265596.1 ribonuclease Z [Candidatus Thermoplasmatota archaeon]
MRLVFLGTGGAWPTKKRNVSSTAVIFRDKVILVDCGEGTQRQIHWSNFSFMKISHVLITHFHTDHFLGLFGLMESMYLNERKRPLEIIGPPGLSWLTDSLCELGMIKKTFPLKVTEVNDGGILDIEGASVSAFVNSHGVRSLGYVIKENQRKGKFNREKAMELGIPEGPLFGKLQQGEDITVDETVILPEMVMGSPRSGRKLVFSGDTHLCGELVKQAVGADVLVHEATYGEDMRDKADEYKHSTARLAAEAARDAGVRHLILTHISPRYDDPEQLIQEAREIFEKATIAEDLMEVTVPYRDSGNDISIIAPVGFDQ